MEKCSSAIPHVPARLGLCGDVVDSPVFLLPAIFRGDRIRATEQEIKQSGRLLSVICNFSGVGRCPVCRMASPWTGVCQICGTAGGQRPWRSVHLQSAM